eukprot:scaffold1555_cov66-Cyclotella_meneghiniana.AAC.3
MNNKMPKSNTYEHKLQGKRSLSDHSFFQSLASIHVNSSQSRRAYIDGNCKVEPSVRAAPPPRRATVCGPTPDLSCTDGQDCPLTPPCNVQSILKTHGYTPPCRPSHRRVSFHSQTTLKKKPPLPFTNQKPLNSRSSHPCMPQSQPVYKCGNDVRAVAPPSTVSTSSFQKACYQQKIQHCSQRKDYTLGETLRSSSHMIIETRPQDTFESVCQLKNYDFAFVRRSNGSWTYSILARRSQDSREDEESMMFVLNQEGQTKVLEKEKWGRHIRRLAGDDSQ